MADSENLSKAEIIKRELLERYSGTPVADRLATLFSSMAEQRKAAEQDRETLHRFELLHGHEAREVRASHILRAMDGGRAPAGVYRPRPTAFN